VSPAHLDVRSPVNVIELLQFPLRQAYVRARKFSLDKTAVESLQAISNRGEFIMKVSYQSRT
jgi:hypothetical protein